MSKSSEAVKKWRYNTKKRIIDSMGGCCQICRYSKCESALALHHIDPNEKELSFGAIRANPKNWLAITEELKKCILVCHNCHSEIHAGIRELPAQYNTFNEEYSDVKKVLEYNECSVCGSQKFIKQKFCSPKCSQTNRRKVDWDSIDLIDLMKKHTIGELEEMLKISNAAIYKRRDKILAHKNLAR